MDEIIRSYWHQIVMFVSLIWAFSRKIGELDRRIETLDVRNKENIKKIEELFKFHNANMERWLSRKEKE